MAALAISVEKSQSVVIWSLMEGVCPCDARFIKAIPNRGGCCVVSPNGILCIPHGGDANEYGGVNGSSSGRDRMDGESTPMLSNLSVMNTTTTVLAYNGFAKY